MDNSPGRPAFPADHLLASLRWRYATQKFDSQREIPGEIWDAIEESLVLTPSSFGLQPWKFVVVGDSEIRTRLTAASWGQPQVSAASHFVVLTARTDLEPADIDAWIERIMEIQGSDAAATAPLKSVIERFAAGMTPAARRDWCIRQTYIALGQLMATAAVLGIDACPMEGLDPAAYDRILGLAGTGYSTIVACALGYRAPDDRHADLPKARFARTRVIERR